MPRITKKKLFKETQAGHEKWFKKISKYSKKEAMKCEEACHNANSNYCEYCSSRYDRANFYHNKY